MNQLSILSYYLSTYEGRDKFLRCFAYSAKFASGFTPRTCAGNFKTVSNEISNSRVVLRLLDDIPTWYDALSCEWIKKVLLSSFS